MLNIHADEHRSSFGQSRARGYRNEANCIAVIYLIYSGSKFGFAQTLHRSSAILFFVLLLSLLYEQMVSGTPSMQELAGDPLMNKNQVKGRANEVKGKVKEAAGKVFGDKSMEYEGKAEEQAGKAEAKFGDVKSDVKSDIKKEEE